MYRFIDTLPIEPDDIENSTLSTEHNTNYLEQVRFTHKVIATVSRAAEIQSVLRESLGASSNNIPTIIESYILSLLYTSSITNSSRSYRSPHYLRRLELVTPYKEKAPLFYRKEIALSNLRTWGGMYGMPSYALHLLGDTNHYLAPYEIADRVINYYLPLLSINENWSDLPLNYLDDNVNPYSLSYLLIQRDSQILHCYDVLQKLSLYLPNLLNRYQENREVLHPYLQEVCKAVIIYGADENISLPHYKFIHQYLSNEWSDLFIDLVRLRKRSPSDRSDEGINEFTSIIPITTSELLLRDASYRLLTQLCSPGGFNLYLMVVSLTLLNRSYSLATDGKNSEANKEFYQAAICLRKSNLSHLQRIANNMIVLSKQSYIPSSTDLLQ